MSITGATTANSSNNFSQWVVVEAAGTPAVNGLYKLNGAHEGSPQYKMEGYWENNPCTFRIKCFGWSSWWIFIRPDESLGDDDIDDLDFYHAPGGGDHSLPQEPPRGGWSNDAHDDERGDLPPPLVTPVNDGRPASLAQVKQKTVRAMMEQVEMQVRCPRWELRLHRAISRYMRSDSAIFCTDACDELFLKHAFAECLSVVEMAFWKASCLTEMPDTVKGYHQYVHWQKEGWKANKAAMYHSTSVRTLVELIIPFLEKPWKTVSSSGRGAASSC